MKAIHRLLLNPLDIRDAMVADRPKATVSLPVHHDTMPQTGPDACPDDDSESCFFDVRVEFLLGEWLNERVS